MNFFQVKFGTNVNQADLLEKIRNLGGHSVQVSDGLVVKCPLSLTELQKNLTTAVVTKIQHDSELTKDAQFFLELS